MELQAVEVVTLIVGVLGGSGGVVGYQAAKRRRTNGLAVTRRECELVHEKVDVQLQGLAKQVTDDGSRIHQRLDEMVDMMRRRRSENPEN